jgi:hypothetical protein
VERVAYFSKLPKRLLAPPKPRPPSPPLVQIAPAEGSRE